MKITPKMGDAWVAYQTAEKIPLEWNWSIASRMLKHAFMSGYAAAQGMAPEGRGRDGGPGSLELPSPVGLADAPKGDA